MGFREKERGKIFLSYILQDENFQNSLNHTFPKCMLPFLGISSKGRKRMARWIFKSEWVTQCQFGAGASGRYGQKDSLKSRVSTNTSFIKLFNAVNLLWSTIFKSFSVALPTLYFVEHNFNWSPDYQNGSEIWRN